ncbi:hypothetical protein [Kitasatospora sp. McL0602]|uniref:hypothetical protein n=1 Tax=Kitasatospora sp. McL0602 TaxID=3439530 RepID=UPI003F8ADE73
MALTIRRACTLALAALLLPLASPTRAAPAPAAPDGISYGAAQPLGSGTLRTYAELDGKRPVAVGAVFTRSALDNLPTEPTDRHHCFDVDGDGTIDDMKECTGGHEHVLDLPPALLSLPGMPLEWALVNWSPMGHGPPGVFDTPHFDVHFYLRPKSERDAIRAGRCGILINCEDFKTATEPIATEYLPADYVDKGIAETAMGNHLQDPTAPEWHGVPFVRTMIYGAYDARITFLEPMVTLRALHQAEAGSAQSECSDIKQPSAWQQPGWYPRQYCVRYRAEAQEFTVSLEDFARH